MRILVVNDDGYQAPGMLGLVSALTSYDCFDTTVIVPSQNCTGFSHSISLDKNIRVAYSKPSFDLNLFIVDGTPADCVYLGLQNLLTQPPALIISGINHGANFGNDLYYSGTAAAAREGALQGIPSFAISHDSACNAKYDYTALGHFVVKFVVQLRQAYKSFDGYMNINIPRDFKIPVGDGPIDYARAGMAKTHWRGAEENLTRRTDKHLVLKVGRERVIDKMHADYPKSDYSIVRERGLVAVSLLAV